jgi:hypothetical protein
MSASSRKPHSSLFRRTLPPRSRRIRSTAALLGFVFVPHITVAEGAAVDDRRTLEDPGWASVAVDAVGRRLELIASDGGRWERIWSLPLGGHAGRRRR